MRAAFTLIELVVVIAIIATLASIVAPSIFVHVAEARRSAARSQLQILALALDQYRLDNDTYPSTEQGLDALRSAPSNADTSRWKGPYLRQAVPADPWGRSYVYRAPGEINPASYDLYTLGRNGQPGGAGEDADLTSWGGLIAK